MTGNTTNRIHPSVWKIDTKCYEHEPFGLYNTMHFDTFGTIWKLSGFHSAPAVDVVLTTRVPPEHRSASAVTSATNVGAPIDTYLSYLSYLEETTLKLQIFSPQNLQIEFILAKKGPKNPKRNMLVIWFTQDIAGRKTLVRGLFLHQHPLLVRRPFQW